MTGARFVLLGCIVIAGGCAAGVVVMPYEPIAAQQIEKIDMPVLLCLTPEFSSAAYSDARGFQVSLGPSLARNSETLARSVFASVEVRTDGSCSSGGSAVLSPKVVSLKQTLPMMTWQPTVTEVIVEWSLRDVAGLPIWVATARGVQEMPIGTNFGYGEKAAAAFAVATDGMFRDVAVRLQALREQQSHGE